MLDLVFASDGQVYDRLAIAEWISDNTYWTPEASPRVTSPVGKGYIDPEVSQ